MVFDIQDTLQHANFRNLLFLQQEMQLKVQYSALCAFGGLFPFKCSPLAALNYLYSPKYYPKLNQPPAGKPLASCSQEAQIV